MAIKLFLAPCEIDYFLDWGGGCHTPPHPPVFSPLIIRSKDKKLVRGRVIYKKNCAIGHLKDLSSFRTTGEFAGIFRISKDFQRIFGLFSGFSEGVYGIFRNEMSLVINYVNNHISNIVKSSKAGSKLLPEDDVCQKMSPLHA